MITTHNGTFTVKNPKTGNHRTFQVRTAKGGKLKGKRIISLLIGPDNTADYLGIGFATDQGAKVWNRYSGTTYEKTLEVLNHLERLNLEVHFETCCRRCNRPLTTPESITSGIGPECAKKGG
jgi:hypothetical protein